MRKEYLNLVKELKKFSKLTHNYSLWNNPQNLEENWRSNEEINRQTFTVWVSHLLISKQPELSILVSFQTVFLK